MDNPIVTLRLPQIDNMRVIAAWLRCLLHTLIPFMVFDTGIWVIHYDNVVNLLPDVIVLTIHSFIMEAFFIIAGLIFILELEKKGIKNYVITRFKRILIPFVLGLLILIPYIALLFSISESLISHDFHWQFESWIQSSFNNWSQQLFVLAHLWFLYYLIIYYVIAIVLYKLKFFNKINLFKNLRLFIWLSIPILYLCLTMSNKWFIENPMTTHVEINSFIYYLIFFIAGIILKPFFYEIRVLLNYKKKIIYGFIFFSLTSAFLINFYAHPLVKYQQIIKYFSMLSTLLQTCTGILFLYIISATNKYQETAFFKFQVKSAYWTYLIHVPIVMTFHLLLYPLEIHLLLKFLIAFVSSMAIANLLYPIIGRKLLNL